jgi:hypothetical protein
MAGMRKAISEGRFSDFYGQTKARWSRGEAEEESGQSLDG